MQKLANKSLTSLLFTRVWQTTISSTPYVDLIRPFFFFFGFFEI